MSRNEEQVWLDVLELNEGHFQGLSQDERFKLLKKAYHQLAKRYHPDAWSPESKISKKDCEENFKAVHHAYKMLTDPNYRAEQDKQGQQGLFAVININLTFEQAFFGMESIITYNATYIDSDNKPMPVFPEDKSSVTLDVDIINVKIPKRSRTGDKITLKGKGLRKGDKKGDLIFVLNVASHPVFRQDGADPSMLYSTCQVPLETMLTGGFVEVPTLFGLHSTRVPAGSLPGNALEIKKLGPKKDVTHLVTIQPEFPTKESLLSKGVWQKLGINWEKEGQMDSELNKKEDEYNDLFMRMGGFQRTSTTTGSAGFF